MKSSPVEGMNDRKLVSLKAEFITHKILIENQVDHSLDAQVEMMCYMTNPLAFLMENIEEAKQADQ